MAGANYMGGRRNVVKARAKDTVARQQKSHFGRQRLDILARGVSALRPSELAHARPSAASTTYKPTAQDIDLSHARANYAHARTKLPVVGLRSGGDKVQKGYIPSPVHVVPSLCSPRSRASMRAPSASEKGKTRRSAVCDALDMSDPVFMRKIMDEILAMPDLAGLGKCRQTSKSRERPATVAHSPSARSAIDDGQGYQSEEQSYDSNKRYPRSEPETLSPFRTSGSDINLPDDDGNIQHHLQAPNVRSPATPYWRQSIRVSEDGFDSPDVDFKRQTSPSYSARESGQNSSRQSESSTSVQRSSHDSGISEYNAWPDPQAASDYSPSWSTRLNDSYSSPRSITRWQDMNGDRIDDTRECDGEYHADSGFHSDVLADSCPSSGIPTVIEFKRPGRHRSGDESSVYGALFEQQDPWRAIGVVLGIEEQEEDSIVGVPAPGIEPRATVEDGLPLDVDHDQLFEELDIEGAFGDVAFRDIPWEEDENDLDTDWDCRFSAVSKGSSNQGPRQQERSPEKIPMEILDYRQTNNALSESAINIEADCNHILGVDDDDAWDGMLVDGEHPKIDSPLMFGTDTCDAMQVNKVPAANEVIQKRILEVPALDEVDGKFVGPALFGEDFSSSEEE